MIRGKNPYMRREDARRVAETARQLFYMARQVPSRVVFQKRTLFFPDERAGLLDGLSGVDDVEMLEITVDPALRYIASRMMRDGLKDDPFPVRRGAAVVLDKRRALLWVHGTAPGVVAGKSYYQGKSRIPAPLIVTRHHGNAPFATVANEILGLSKMDWNTFDLYSKLPATIRSSNAIARIGVLLERFGPVSYDYRLFI